MDRQPALIGDAPVERRARIRRDDVEGRRPLEHRPVVAIHAEDETAVDHQAEVVQAADGGRVVAPQVLVFPLLDEVLGIQRLEPDEQAAQPRLHCPLEEVRREHRVDRAGGLPEAAHPAHAVEERRGEAAVAEQVVVEEIQVATRQPLDFRQLRVHGLRIEGTAASKKASL